MREYTEGWDLTRASTQNAKKKILLLYISIVGSFSSGGFSRTWIKTFEGSACVSDVH